MRDLARSAWMTLWQMLVLAVVKQGLGIDYDRLEDTVNEHRTLRRMLQHADDDGYVYTVQTLKNSVDLLTPELLRKVNNLVALDGLSMSGKSPLDELGVRVDSFVDEYDVHYPTHVNLLWYATRAAVREVAKLADSITYRVGVRFSIA